MTHLQNRRTTKGRHPLLKTGTLSQRVFNHLKHNPGASIAEVAKTLHEEYQSVNGNLQRMKGAGLVMGAPRQLGNRVVTGFYPVVENETGFARDVVAVDVTMFVNQYGEYSCTAKVVGQLVTADEDNPRPIHVAQFKVVVPKPNEPLKTRMMFSPDFTGNGTSFDKSLVIEGEVIDSKDK